MLTGPSATRIIKLKVQNNIDGKNGPEHNIPANPPITKDKTAASKEKCVSVADECVQSDNGEKDAADDSYGLRGIDQIVKQWRFFTLMSGCEENLKLKKGAWIVYNVSQQMLDHNKNITRCFCTLAAAFR